MAGKLAKVDVYCPGCGNYPMVARDDQCGGDYYEGEQFNCTKCGFVFSTKSIEVSDSIIGDA